MKIKYTFATGETTEVEVNEEIGTVIMDSRRAEHAQDERKRYHCPFSSSTMLYEGLDYADPNSEKQFDFENEDSKRIYSALEKLSKTQKRRLLMLADGLSIREIARLENIDFKSAWESIESARKKFLKFF